MHNGQICDKTDDIVDAVTAHLAPFNSYATVFPSHTAESVGPDNNSYLPPSLENYFCFHVLQISNLVQGLTLDRILASRWN